MAGRISRYQTRSRLRVLQVPEHDDNNDDSVAGESCDTISALLYIDVECKVTAVTGPQTRRLMLSVGMVQASEQAAVPLWDEGPSSSRGCIEERVLWSVRWPTRLRPRVGFALWLRVRTWITLVQFPSKKLIIFDKKPFDKITPPAREREREFMRKRGRGIWWSSVEGKLNGTRARCKTGLGMIFSFAQTAPRAPERDSAPRINCAFPIRSDDSDLMRLYHARV